LVLAVRPRRPRISDPVDEALEECPDRVADAADGVKVLAGRVLEDPVPAALPGEDRAGVTAGHGDDDIRGFDGPGSQDLG
jgi:hypothetical protein